MQSPVEKGQKVLMMGDDFWLMPQSQRPLCSNICLRLRWEHEYWQPTLNLLYHTVEGGRLWTAALLYKGDRVRLQGGLRISTGGADAALGQLPTGRQA